MAALWLFGALALHSAHLANSQCPVDLAFFVKWLGSPKPDDTCYSGNQKEPWVVQFWSMWACGDSSMTVFSRQYAADGSYGKCGDDCEFLNCGGQCSSQQTDFACRTESSSDCVPPSRLNFGPAALEQECGISGGSAQCTLSKLLPGVGKCRSAQVVDQKSAEDCKRVLQGLNDCGHQNTTEVAELVQVLSMMADPKCADVKSGAVRHVVSDMLECSTVQAEADVKRCLYLLESHSQCAEWGSSELLKLYQQLKQLLQPGGGDSGDKNTGGGKDDSKGGNSKDSKTGGKNGGKVVDKKGKKPVSKKGGNSAKKVVSKKGGGKSTGKKSAGGTKKAPVVKNKGKSAKKVVKKTGKAKSGGKSVQKGSGSKKVSKKTGGSKGGKTTKKKAGSKKTGGKTAKKGKSKKSSKKKGKKGRKLRGAVVYI